MKNDTQHVIHGLEFLKHLIKYWSHVKTSKKEPLNYIKLQMNLKKGNKSQYWISGVKSIETLLSDYNNRWRI